MGSLLEAILVIFLTIIIVFLIGLYIYINNLLKFWSNKNIPFLKPDSLCGNTKGLLLLKESFSDTFIRIYNEIKKQSKIAGGFYFFAKPMLMIIDPELIKKILAKDFGNFHNRDSYVNEKSDPLSAHLASLKDMQWRTMRAKLTPAFTSGKIKMMFETIKDCTKDLNEFINENAEKHEPIDTKELFSRLTTDTIVSCAFGIECNSIKNPENEFRKYGQKIFELGIREAIVNALSQHPWILDYLEMPMTNPKITKFFMAELKNIIEYREKNNVKRNDFLNLLIRLKNNQSVLDEDSEEQVDVNGGLTFEELAAHAFVFFVGGSETISTTLNFTLYELAVNSEIQRKLRKEIRDVLGKNNQKITYDAIKSMKYMDKIVEEILRLYPPLPILLRQCTEDYYVSELDYTIKKGDTVAISSLGLQRDPEHYFQPDKFDPERFTEEGKSSRHPYTYLPFGEGPRICIGNRFALVEVKLVLTVLLKDFEFYLDSKTVTPIRFDPKTVFISPLDRIWMQARKT